MTAAIDTALVARLVAGQFPEWAGLAVRPVPNDGWDNRTFRLGDRLSARLPSAEGYVLQVEKEHRWLPVLAPALSLPIPVPVARGNPAAGYPWPWSVYEWLDGETAALDRIDDLTEFARTLAEFLIELAAIDSRGGPGPGPHNGHRGGDPSFYDGETRAAIVSLGDRIDGAAATRVWDAALATRWTHEPVWFHGDVAVGNLLVRNGRLSAVIDFGTSGVGDPACDLVIAWTLLDGRSREEFRSTLAPDDGTWARGRGWALWKALIVAAGAAGTNSPGIGRSLEVIDRVLADAAGR